jgi:hypothetical protein
MPPLGMYEIVAPCSGVPGAAVHSIPIAKRSHTSQVIRCAPQTGLGDANPFILER